MAAYNAYINMKYGRSNVLTRIIDAAKRHELDSFTPARINELLSEGGQTPEQTIKACITCRTVGYAGLGSAKPHFVRVGLGVYALADRK